MTDVSRAMLKRIAELEHYDCLRRSMSAMEMRDFARLTHLLDSDRVLGHDDAKQLLTLFTALVPPSLRW